MHNSAPALKSCQEAMMEENKEILPKGFYVRQIQADAIAGSAQWRARRNV